VANAFATVRNSSANLSEHLLCSFTNSEGLAVPDIFPETIQDMLQLSDADLDLLLNYYSLEMNGTIAEKRKRFATHIGVR
jgi:hypothetical protein